MRMRTLVLVLCFFACGGSSSRSVDANPTSDGMPPDDAKVAPVESNVSCTDYTRTVTHANGERSVIVGKWAIIDDIGFGDTFRVRTCLRPAPAPTCQVDQTCSGATIPTGQMCFEATDGNFIDGKLLIACGSTSTYYRADNTVMSMSDNTYESVTLIR